jgi:polar amino acid transport system substrate-binding protein
MQPLFVKSPRLASCASRSIRGNPILSGSRTSGVSPAGVTVDLSREFAGRLGVEALFGEFKTAAKSLVAVTSGAADIGFMAIDPERAAGMRFTCAYLEIIGSYVVPAGSSIQHNEEVDQPGNEVVVGQASAYDFVLTRHVKKAKLLRVPVQGCLIAPGITPER